RFDHAGARHCLEPYRGEMVLYWRFLGCLTGEDNAHGFEWVEDLVRNAERRQSQGRYDDAVGRVYRAVELTAQVWLQLRHGLETSNVDLGKIPEAQRAALVRPQPDENGAGPGKIKIGLLQAWDVVAAFPDDPLGALF